MIYNFLRKEVDLNAGIARVTLNRPGKRNALSQDLLSELLHAYDEMSREQGIRAIVMQGAGRNFCSGMDLHELGGLVEAWETDLVPWSEPGTLVQLIQVIRRHPCVTIAAVEGYCGGGGLALMVAQDLAVACDDAKFILPETQRGSFGALASAAIHHALPPKVAFDMQLSGLELAGSAASAYGLVSRSVSPELFDDTVDAMATSVASRGRAPLTHAKMAAYTSEGMSFERALFNDIMVGARQNRSADSFSGVDEFLEGRRVSQPNGSDQK